MSKQDGHSTKGLVPRLRFPEFRSPWSVDTLGPYLHESRVIGSKGNVARKITVKLWGNGVFEKVEATRGSRNTQYYRRSSGQFIYSKLDFLNQAFGIIPKALDGFESTLDLPCFDIGEGLSCGFLLTYVMRKAFYGAQRGLANGGRKAVRIKPDVFLSVPVALPTFGEQQKIADCLSSLDDRITAETRQLDALKTHKQGLLQQLFPREGETVPRLRSTKFQSATPWERRSLGDVCHVFQGYGFPVTMQGRVSGQYPFAKVSDITRAVTEGGGVLRSAANYIDDAERASLHAKTVPAGATVFAKIGEALKLNRRALVGMECVIDNNSAGIKVKPGKGVDGFMFQLAQLIDLGKYCGGAVPAVSKSAIEAIEVTVPPIEDEQEQIANCLTSLDDLIAAQAKKIDLLKQHKRGLMQQLFPVFDEDA